MPKKPKSEIESQKTPKTIRLDDIHWEIIKGLTPFYGNNESEVVRNIVMMWLHENIGNDTMKELQSLKAIDLNKLLDKND